MELIQIMLEGSRIAVKLNGKTTVDARNDQFTSGTIALQANGPGSAGGAIGFGISGFVRCDRYEAGIGVASAPLVHDFSPYSAPAFPRIYASASGVVCPQAVPGQGGNPNRAEPLRKDGERAGRDVPVSSAVTMSLIVRTSGGVSRWGDVCGQDD